MSKPMYSEVQDTSKLPAHLAKYLQPVKKKKKKRRTGSGLTIIDDDLSLSRKGGTQELYSEEEDEQPRLEAEPEERPAAADEAPKPRPQTSSWKAAGGGASSSGDKPKELSCDQGSSTRSFSAPGLHRKVASEVAEIQAKQAAELKVADATALGATNATVYRDRRGKVLEGASQMEEAAKGGQQEKVKPQWGGGLAQKRSKDEQRDYEREVASKPMAQFADDSDRDREKRGTERWGDPMLEQIQKEKSKRNPNLPKYRGPAPPPNRFNIGPGYRWDGVDRSNSYEKQFFMAQAKARMEASLAHTWATEDM